MEIRADIVLQAVLKSFSDVILPALDSDNRLAQEQGQLMLGLLTLLKDRLPLQYQYDRDELARLLALGEELQVAAADVGFAEKLRDCHAIYARVGAAPQELVDAIAALRSIISERVEKLAAEPPEIREPGFKAVLSAAREQHLRERSWLLIQGWETDPGAVPAIESLIDLKGSPGVEK